VLSLFGIISIVVFVFCRIVVLFFFVFLLCFQSVCTITIIIFCVAHRSHRILLSLIESSSIRASVSEMPENEQEIDGGVLLPTKFVIGMGKARKFTRPLQGG